MSIGLWILIFVISLALLIKASDFFTDAAERIGLSLGLPAFIIGVTIVAIGTSLPELVSSIVAVLNGSSEIVVGNVVGSNIANIFLVLGLAAIIARKKLMIAFELIHVDLPLLVGSAFLLTLSIWDGYFSAGEAIISILLLVVYILYTTRSEKDDPEIKKEIKDIKKSKLEGKDIAILLASSLFIYLGAKYTIDSVVRISEILNIATSIIAVTAVALGTSLPELMVSISAAKKGKPEIAVGNVLGSNIFNALAVMGIPALIGGLAIPQEILMFSLPVMIVATLLYFFITQDKQISRWEGWCLVIFYVFFVGKIFNII